MPRWRRSEWRRERPGPDVPCARARDPARRGRSRSIRSSTARPPAPTSPGDVRRGARVASTLRLSRLKLELGVTADDVAGDPEAGPVARAFVDYERAVAGVRRRSTSTTSVLRAIARLEADPALLAALARALRATARRRGPGRRPGCSSASPSCSRRPANSIFLVGRRRPVDLWLAAGRCPPDPRARGASARVCVGSTSRSTTAARARSSSARSGSSSTTASGSPRRSAPGRPPPGA